MPSQPLDSLRLAVMQEWLPLGLAVVDRARRGGVSAVVEGFTQAEDPPVAVPLAGVGDLQSALARIGERLQLLEQRLGAEP